MTREQDDFNLDCGTFYPKKGRREGGDSPNTLKNRKVG